MSVMVMSVYDVRGVLVCALLVNGGVWRVRGSGRSGEEGVR